MSPEVTSAQSLLDDDAIWRCVEQHDPFEETEDSLQEVLPPPPAAKPRSARRKRMTTLIKKRMLRNQAKGVAKAWRRGPDPVKIGKGESCERQGKLWRIHGRVIEEISCVVPDMACRPISVDISDVDQEPVDPEDTIDPEIAAVFAEETSRVACEDPLEIRKKKVSDDIDPWDREDFDALAGDPRHLAPRCVS